MRPFDAALDGPALKSALGPDGAALSRPHLAPGQARSASAS